MTPAAIRALELRQQLAKTSTSKLEAFANRTGPDGRLRHEYLWGGAHTLRWSSRGVQIHNLPRGTLKPEVYDAAVEAIRLGDDVSRFGPVQDVVSSTLRGAFRAPEGYHFVVSDLAQIEVRVLAWLSGCPRLTAVFEQKLDPYIAFAAAWLGKRPEEVTKDERQIAKPAVLAAGFGQGPGKAAVDKNGDQYHTGLIGYAARMGITLTVTQAADLVYSYRSIHYMVTKLWQDLDEAVLHAAAYGHTTTVGKVVIGAIPDKLLWIALPSGRRLHYPRPAVDGNDITYHGWLGKKAVRNKLWYGEVVNNCVQSVARDTLVEGMLAADADGFTLSGHTHDELIALERVESDYTVSRLTACMSRCPAWAPGLLVAADGYASQVYRK